MSLLDRIPEHLKDVPVEALEGETPRQAAAHFDETGCRYCWFVLREMGE